VLARYDYDPYGNTLSAGGAEASNNAYRFSTKPQEELTGDYYYRYRFYSPDLGRWRSRDVIEEPGGMNLYGFVFGQPTFLFDILGREPATSQPANRDPKPGTVPIRANEPVSLDGPKEDRRCPTELVLVGQQKHDTNGDRSYTNTPAIHDAIYGTPLVQTRVTFNAAANGNDQGGIVVGNLDWLTVYTLPQLVGGVPYPLLQFLSGSISNRRAFNIECIEKHLSWDDVPSGSEDLVGPSTLSSGGWKLELIIEERKHWQTKNCGYMKLAFSARASADGSTTVGVEGAVQGGIVVIQAGGTVTYSETTGSRETVLQLGALTWRCCCCDD